jgi:hypothetical protein
MKTCGWYDAAVRKYPELASTDIQTRYDAYNRVFMERGENIALD